MRQYIIASILIIIGLLSILFRNLVSNEILNQVFGDFSGAVLVSGLLSLLFKIFQDKESVFTLRRLLRIHDSIDDLGLVEIKSNVLSYDYSELILNSNTLNIVMNDGQRWIGNNAVQLEKRFSKKSETNFFTVDPNSDFIVVLASKTGANVDSLKIKIEDSWKRLKDAYEKSEKKGELNIYSLKTYPTKSVFLSETELIETPYQISCGRVNIPLYIYKKVFNPCSPYYFVYNDVESLKKESTLQYSSKSKVEDSSN